VEKVVKGCAGGDFFQVVENVDKINFGKCPKDGLQYDIIVL
jgi:hypothetical protein